jgi:precorrin-6y C5,15-methyltransferase (decarboxylating) CbiE subunit
MPAVNVIGCGPGRRSLMTAEAERAALGADILYGSARLIALFEEFAGRTVPIENDLPRALDEIEKSFRDRRIGVLVSGDVGFHSFASSIVGRIGRGNCRLHPGISSVQYGFSLLGLSWEDALLLSGHGEDLPGLARAVAAHGKIAILADGKRGVGALFSGLSGSLFDKKRIYVLENLSYEDERVRRVGFGECVGGTFAPLSVVVIVNRELCDV